MDAVSRIAVVQHTSSESLGLIEDHFEGRRIAFTYHRPFTERGRVPDFEQVGDGLVLLGGGPWGSAGPRNVPTLIEEVELTHACLAAELPVIGVGLGAQILCLAAGGRTHAAPLTFSVGEARRTSDTALNGYLPERFPEVVWMRDRFEPPLGAQVLACADGGEVSVFQIGERAFGFRGHPGFKPAMGEDLVMEFEEAPDDPAAGLTAARAVVRRIEDALVPIMTGLVMSAGLMERR